jgi:hypothetical protein
MHETLLPQHELPIACRFYKHVLLKGYSMASDGKTEEVREYYLGKLREAKENALVASGREERVKWRKIALGYEMLAGVPGTARDLEEDNTITTIGSGAQIR